MRAKLHILSCLLPLGLAAMAGCASFSNPTTFPSVPVRRLPEELLGKPREEQLDIPQAMLRQRKPTEHRIDAGDVLGIVLDGYVGAKDQPAPVTLPQVGAISQNIGLGYPFPVLDNGTVNMPLLNEPVDVRGLTISEAQREFRRLYVEKGKLQEDEANRLIVTLFRPRMYHVLVVRQDSNTVQFGPAASYGGSKRGSGVVLDMPAYENDVLNALSRSGGLPGVDAKNEIIIQRGYLKGELTTMPPPGPIPGLETVRIPLRLRPGERIPFKPDDVILNDGDIVFIQSRDTEVFYTGGLLFAGEWALPRDYDLDVLTAVVQTKSPLANGGVNFNNLQGNITAPGMGSPSPSQLTVLRKAPGKRQITIRVDLNRAMQDPRERILVQPGDVLILQETMGESLTRYMTTQFKFISAFNILNTPDAITNLNSSVP